MRKARIFVNGAPAGILIEEEMNKHYIVRYDPDYQGGPISLTMPVRQADYVFDRFPPFFDGVLPEGLQLEALLKLAKIDRHDCFSQLVTVGKDLVGYVTVEKIHD